MAGDNLRVLIRNFIIEIIVYGILVVAYFFMVLRLLNDWMTGLFSENLVLYAVLSLVLVVAQAVLLDAVTTFLLDWLNLERLE